MRMPKKEYNKKLIKERKWYTERKFDKNHFLNSRIFFSRERNMYSYHVSKSYLPALLTKYGLEKKSKLLCAPVGRGLGIKYIKNSCNNIHGIDISKQAIKECPSIVRKRVGNIKEMPYSSNSFDFVLSLLFFHHVIDEGFDVYLREFHRVLKKNGMLIISEPSCFYPIFWITALMRHLVGNITGKVEHERPLNPISLKKSIIKNNFNVQEIFSSSYSHNRFPIFAARLLRYFAKIFGRFPAIRYCGFNVYFIAKKLS